MVDAVENSLIHAKIPHRKLICISDLHVINHKQNAIKLLVLILFSTYNVTPSLVNQALNVTSVFDSKLFSGEMCCVSMALLRNKVKPFQSKVCFFVAIYHMYLTFIC